MTKTTKNYKETETIKRRGKLRYLERLAEDEEAEKEISEYQPEEQEEFPENDEK